MKARIPGGGARNGLTRPGGYVYRGSKRLDDSNSYLCEGGCGRRLENKPGPRMGSCAVCRESPSLDFTDRPRRPELLRIASEHRP